MDDDLNRRYNEAFDTLPALTRAVYMLSRIDDLAYPDIAWRCGLSVAEVELRLADALSGMCQALDDRPDRQLPGTESIVERRQLGAS